MLQIKQAITTASPVFLHVCVCVLVAQSCPAFCDPWTVASQAPLSMEFSRQKYWSGLPFSSPGNLPNPGIEPRSSTLQADSLQSEPPGKPNKLLTDSLTYFSAYISVLCSCFSFYLEVLPTSLNKHLLISRLYSKNKRKERKWVGEEKKNKRQIEHFSL